MDRLQLLTFVHSTLVESHRLKKADRPYGLASRLDTIQKQIMEELERSNPSGAKVPPKAPDNHDDIPF